MIHVVCVHTRYSEHVHSTSIKQCIHWIHAFVYIYNKMIAGAEEKKKEK